MPVVHRLDPRASIAKADQACGPTPYLYRNRNVIERMFGRLKDFRRIATRYDRSATNFMAAIHIVATVAYWL
ncbi:Mobile element protein [Azospirillum palustre]